MKKNMLHQLAALMRVSVAYTLGRTPSPTPIDAPTDLAKLTPDEIDRLQKIGTVTGNSIAELLGLAKPPPKDTNAKPPSDKPPKPPKDFGELQARVGDLVGALQKNYAELSTSLALLGTSVPRPPGDNTTDPPTDPDKDPDMPIVRPDTFHAHVRLSIDGDKITVEKATGINRNSVRFATDAPEGNCSADSSQRTSNTLVYAKESDKRPKNAQLVRMDLASDHKIDPSEVVVIVTAADRETAYRHDFAGFSVSDGTIDAVIRDPEPDVGRPKLQARLDIMAFRIG